MRRVSITVSLSLDGVMQAPGRPDEDSRGGFERGGWANDYSDEVMGRRMAEGMSQETELLFGRRTYQDFFSVWPNRTDNPFTKVLDRTPKYVASRTIAAPLPWQNSTLLSGDAADSVADLKRSPGPDLTVLGSGNLIQTLRKAGLVDEYFLLIHPLIIGTGSRLFPEGPPSDLRLAESLTTSTGVIIAVYQQT